MELAKVLVDMKAQTKFDGEVTLFISIFHVNRKCVLVCEICCCEGMDMQYVCVAREMAKLGLVFQQLPSNIADVQRSSLNSQI